MRNVAVIIPAYVPDPSLIDYVKQLINEVRLVIVIDDGNTDDQAALFETLAGYEQVEVLHHLINRGKGVGLRTAYDYLLKHHREIEGIVTTDADGQLLVKDVLHVADVLLSSDNNWVLGVRAFDHEYTPRKNKLGNQTTSRLFQWLFGTYYQDTQTGLRAFRREQLLLMASIPGQKFEYEMNVLIAMTLLEASYAEVPIETVYVENQPSHYHVLNDSLAIAGEMIHAKRHPECLLGGGTVR
ncbi:MAG: glycosyltransferase family 2 protein [Aerococcus sp.]|nr:glycosyltransferase family 2 protein [Aerococcus sp.]